MTSIEFLVQNRDAFQKQLEALKDIKVKQLHVLHDLEQLEQKYEKQLVALNEYIAQEKTQKEFQVIEAVVETLAAKPIIVEPKIEEKPQQDFVEILPEEPQAIIIPEPEIKHTKTVKTAEENLNEKLAKVRQESTVEKLNHTKIEDLRKAFNINQAMAFSKAFFNGDNSQFTIFIDALNNCGSVNAANTIIQSQLDRNKNQELYNDLVHLAERRWQ